MSLMVELTIMFYFNCNMTFGNYEFSSSETAVGFGLSRSMSVNCERRLERVALWRKSSDQPLTRNAQNAEDDWSSFGRDSSNTRAAALEAQLQQQRNASDIQPESVDETAVTESSQLLEQTSIGKWQRNTPSLPSVIITALSHNMTSALLCLAHLHSQSRINTTPASRDFRHAGPSLWNPHIRSISYLYSLHIRRHNAFSLCCCSKMPPGGQSSFRLKVTAPKTRMLHRNGPRQIGLVAHNPNASWA